MNHLKTLTMVSMKSKVVSRDSFLDKLSEKALLEWILRRLTGFLLGGGGGGGGGGFRLKPHIEVRFK